MAFQKDFTAQGLCSSEAGEDAGCGEEDFVDEHVYSGGLNGLGREIIEGIVVEFIEKDTE